MPKDISHELFSHQIFPFLEETFEKVEGIYLDRGTSLSETLDTISAVEASTPPIEGGTSIAGHVEHIRFYIRVMNDYMDGVTYEKLDWKQSWLLHTVTDVEWVELKEKIRDDYQGLLTHLRTFPDWANERRLGDVIGIIAHTAFHIGAIRQMAKALKK